MHERYLDQVRLLLSVLPDIAQQEVFALKGGTAINLFYRDMPRLSVDIDLAYLPVGARDAALHDIDARLERIMAAITSRNPQLRARRVAGGGDNDTRIMVSTGQAQIKIETSPVMRGAVYPPGMMLASDAVIDAFGFAEMQVLAFEDLYAGKLHAALDRQHPRDLFDVKLLYETDGLSDDLFRVFMAYLASSPRPMHELLAPQAPLDATLYDAEFLGMTRAPVAFEELVCTRTRLHGDIRARLSGDIAAFLLSLHDAVPEFTRIGLPDVANLPAIRWKLINLERLKRDDPEKHAAQRAALERLLR
jgi:predicted nucleotidyltransferase component of viral defense system